MFIQRHSIGIHSNAQAWSIHFALFFIVLSECEHYRIYLQRFNTSFLETLVWANTDKGYEESRDAFSYWLTGLPGSWAPSLDLPPLGLLVNFMRVAVVFCLFLVVLALLNYPIKRFANPDPASTDLVQLAGGREVFFSSDKWWLHVVAIYFLRPMRLLNRMLFWSCMELLECAWVRYKRIRVVESTQ